LIKGAGASLPVLVMCGNSGNCKSAAVETICHDVGIEVRRWNDDLLPEKLRNDEVLLFDAFSAPQIIMLILLNLCHLLIV
jgi:hypothetical protein